MPRSSEESEYNQDFLIVVDLLRRNGFHYAEDEEDGLFYIVLDAKPSEPSQPQKFYLHHVLSDHGKRRQCIHVHGRSHLLPYEHEIPESFMNPSPRCQQSEQEKFAGKTEDPAPSHAAFGKTPPDSSSRGGEEKPRLLPANQLPSSLTSLPVRTRQPRANVSDGRVGKSRRISHQLPSKLTYRTRPLPARVTDTEGGQSSGISSSSAPATRDRVRGGPGHTIPLQPDIKSGSKNFRYENGTSN